MKAVFGIFSKKQKDEGPKRSADEGKNNQIVSCQQTKNNTG